MNGMRVINPGLLTLLQDYGRYGWHRHGLTTGGPMDLFAYGWCNRLLGNPLGATTLEVMLGGLQLESMCNTQLCITGAEVVLTVNGQQRPLWQSLAIKRGDIIELGMARQGQRAYLGVQGGFTIHPKFGSSATVCREQIGGLDGGPVRASTVLRCPGLDNRHYWRLAAEHIPTYAQALTLRLLPGYQYDLFGPEQLALLFQQSYSVTTAFDRMGCQLSGNAISPPVQALLSEGISHGAVQIPPSGQPIIMLADRQTTGGYHKPGTCLRLDTDALAQCRPGAKVSFERIDAPAAVALLRQAWQQFQQIEPVPA